MLLCGGARLLLQEEFQAMSLFEMEGEGQIRVFSNGGGGGGFGNDMRLWW